MEQDRNDRIKSLENALKDPPPFIPMKRPAEGPSPPSPPPLSQLVEMLRTHAKSMLDLADQIEQHVDGGEESMKRAIDHLMDTVKRMK